MLIVCVKERTLAFVVFKWIVVCCRHKNMKKQPCENITVAYYFCGEPIPYRTSVKGRIVTLGQFKELLTKKGSYRYVFFPLYNVIF